jgi:ribosomal protein S20
MAIAWMVENQSVRSWRRTITLKRVDSALPDEAESLSVTLHRDATKAQFKAEFKKMFLKEKAERVAMRQFFKTSDLTNFETEINS